MKLPDNTITQIGTDANGKFFLENSAGRRYRPTHRMVIVRETQIGQTLSPDIFEIYHAEDKYYRSPLFTFDQADITAPAHTDADDLEQQLLEFEPFFFDVGGGGGRQYDYIFPDNATRDSFFGGLTTPIAELERFQTIILVGVNEEQIWEGQSSPATYVNTNWRVVNALTTYMTRATYDPGNVNANAFARSNHTGTQAQSTVTNLVSDLAGKAAVNTVPKPFSRQMTAADVTNGYLLLPENASGVHSVSLNGIVQFDPATLGFAINITNADRLDLPAGSAYRSEGFQYFVEYLPA